MWPPVGVRGRVSSAYLFLFLCLVRFVFTPARAQHCYTHACVQSFVSSCCRGSFSFCVALARVVVFLLRACCSLFVSRLACSHVPVRARNTITRLCACNRLCSFVVAVLYLSVSRWRSWLCFFCVFAVVCLSRIVLAHMSPRARATPSHTCVCLSCTHVSRSHVPARARKHCHTRVFVCRARTFRAHISPRARATLSHTCVCLSCTRGSRSHVPPRAQHCHTRVFVCRACTFRAHMPPRARNTVTRTRACNRLC